MKNNIILWSLITVAFGFSIIIFSGCDSVMSLITGKEKLKEEILLKSKRMINGEGAKVMRNAHPTVSFRGSQYLGIEEKENGEFHVVYDLEYQSIITQSINYLELKIKFDKKGVLIGTEWGRDTGIVPPGAATSTINKILEEYNASQSQ